MNTFASPNFNIIIQKKYNFLLDSAVFANTYNPIITAGAVNLYINMYNYCQVDGKNLNLTSKVADFLNNHNINIDTFNKNRVKLEAIGLIQTFYDEYKNTYYFVLIPPREFNELCKDIKIKGLYINNNSYEKLNYAFNAVKELVPINAINVSSNIEALYEQQEKIPGLDMESILTKIRQHLTHEPVISPECLNILNTQCLCFSENEIVNLIINGLKINNDGRSILQKDLLINNINNLFNTNIRFNRNFKIYRNPEIFKNLNYDLTEKEKVFNSYQVDSEQYLYSLQKDELNKWQLELIKNLRKKITDKYINMIFDFTSFLIGKINNTYINSIIKTIISKNLDHDLDALYSYCCEVYAYKTKGIVADHSTKQHHDNEAVDLIEELVEWDNE